MPDNVDQHGNFVPAGTSSPSGFSMVPNPGMPPIAEADVAAAFAQHQKYLASISEHDPRSLYHGRPDLAAAARAKAEQDFAGLRMKYGVSAPVPKSSEQVAEERFNDHWGGLPELSDSTHDMMDVELDRLEANGAAFAHGVAELKKEYGEEGYQKLISQAKLAIKPGEPWRPAIEASRPVLNLLASYGRYQTAYEAAKAKQPT